MLDVHLLAQRLHEAGFVGESPRYSRVTTSTQDEARAIHRIGKRAPYSAVTDEQTSGRGRLGRSWDAPAGSAILLTVAMPQPAELTAFPLLVGASVVRTLHPFVPQLRLKWPNDLVVVWDGELRKLGGLIAEVHADVVLVGIGVNVSLREHELPTRQAISLQQLGIEVEREMLIAAIITACSDWTPPTLADYRALCITIGERVLVTFTDGSTIEGTAEGIGADGTLVVDGVDVSAGDVQHVRSS